MRFFALVIFLFFAFSHGYFGRVNESLAVFGWASLLQSPRTVALEGAGSALPSGDFGAPLINPALLSVDNIGFGASWQSGDLAEQRGLLAFSHLLFGIKTQHTYGFVGNGEVEHRDELGELTGETSRPAAQYYSLTMAFPLEHFTFGLTGRYLWERLGETEESLIGMGLALDWGFAWNSSSTRYSFALMGRNLGSQIRPFVKGGVNGFPMSSELAASAFWRSNQKLAWLFECSAPRYAPVAGKLGFEYRFSEPIMIRAGMQRDIIDVVRKVRSAFDSSENSAKTGYYRLFSLGAGYRVWNFALDYSYSMLIEGMGSEQHIGLSGNF